MRFSLRDSLHSAIFLLIVLGAVSVGRAQDTKPKQLVIESPMPYEVFQRRTAARGVITVRGQVVDTTLRAREIRACIWKEVPGKSNALLSCRRLKLDRSSHQFSGKLQVAAGGFYSVEMRVLGYGLDRAALGNEEVPHVGVGEVFVVSGQSNSTNYGEVKQTVHSGMVTTFDGSTWRIADDPQPGVQDGSKGGSFIPSFGDAMYARYHVPIGIASVGYGGTSVRQWMPKRTRFATQPTATKFVTPAGTRWQSDGTLFNGMVARMRQLGPHGFRAVLWHQGESDAHQAAPHEISAEEYERLMVELIEQTRRAAGWKMPWFVAEVSYHSPTDPAAPEIRDAQQKLWQSGIALEGPDTDTLTGMNRQNGGKGIHLSDAGLKAHGKMWAEKVEPWLDTVLR